jgi:hypothetical protein
MRAASLKKKPPLERCLRMLQGRRNHRKIGI